MPKIVANWKMYLTIQQSRERAALIRDWFAKQEDCSGLEFVLCPSTLAIQDAQQQLGDAPVRVGCQQLSVSEELGAFTGQIAGQHARELHLDYCLAGHSETREFYQVDDAMVRRQVAVAYQHGITPIICIGETEDDRTAGRTDQLIISQLETIFQEMPEDLSAWIAYEPRWAIGTGKPVDPSEANRVHQLIQKTLADLGFENMHVLYGGSVSAETLTDFLDEDAIDGVLIGSASARPEKLTALLESIQSDIC